MEVNNNFIKDLKIRNFFPFYIDKINEKFFNSTAKKVYKPFLYKNKYQKFTSYLDKDEIKKFNEFESILNHENIENLLNQIAWKIVAKTGNDNYDFFSSNGLTSTGQPRFIVESEEVYDLKIIGNSYSHKRYIYTIDIDPNSYLFDFIEQIQIAFFIDEKNKSITGGFSLNYGKEKPLKSFEEIIKKIYLNSIWKNFVTKELAPFSIDNILGVMDLYNEEDFVNKKKFKKNKNKTNNQINKQTLLSLKKKWSDFLKEKLFLNDDKNFFIKNKKYYQNEMFYACLNVILVCLTLYEELKKYFATDKPEIYISLSKKIEYVKINENQDAQQDFYELINLLKNRYFIFEKNKKNIQDINDAIEALIEFDQVENESIGLLSTSYELTRNTDIPFLDKDDDIFMNSKDLKIVYLLIYKPELFGINDLSLDFLNFNVFYKNIKKIEFNNLWDDLLDQLVDQTICEWNYDYVSFINENFSNLIIKNNNPIKSIHTKNKKDYEYDQNKKIYDNYLWSFIFAKTLIWKLKIVDENSNNANLKQPWLLRQNLNELETLWLDWYDSFYGIPQVKNIIKKIDTFYKFNNLNKVLKKKISKNDKIYGKQKERKNLFAAFFSAVVFGLLDFFTMVYSVLAVYDSNKKINNTGAIIIGIGSVFCSILFFIFIFKIFLNFKKKTKQK